MHIERERERAKEEKSKMKEFTQNISQYIGIIFIARRSLLLSTLIVMRIYTHILYAKQAAIRSKK